MQLCTTYSNECCALPHPSICFDPWICSSNTQAYKQLLSKKPIAAEQCLRKLAPFLFLELRFIWNHSKKSFLEPKWIEEYLLRLSKEPEPPPCSDLWKTGFSITLPMDVCFTTWPSSSAWLTGALCFMYCSGIHKCSVVPWETVSILRAEQECKRST